ncbi:MAG: M17 family peptidase N-terminal domain-containing protein [Nannocystaceae bacterium]
MTIAPASLAFLDQGLAPDGPARFDLVVLPVFTDERPLTGLAGFFDWRLAGALSAMLRRQLCTGASGEQVLTVSRKTACAVRLVTVGLGARATFDDAAAARAGEQILGLCQTLVGETVAVGVPGGRRGHAAARRLLAHLLAAHEAAQAAPGHAGSQLWIVAAPEAVEILTAPA